MSTNTSNSSISLSVDDFFGCEDCHVMLAAITPVGPGPEEEVPVQLYSSKSECVSPERCVVPCTVDWEMFALLFCVFIVCVFNICHLTLRLF